MLATISVPTSTVVLKATNGKRKVRPTWEMADYYPLQGEWTEKDYLDLPEDGRRIELVDGFLEFLPMPTKAHELIQEWLHNKLRDFVVERRLGEVYRNGRRIKLRQLNIRLPDEMYIPFSKVDPDDNKYALGADVVMEIVSGGSKDRERDLVEKFKDYATAGFLEYWIVDPKLQTITVFNLKHGRYALRREFKRGEIAVSKVLKGFEVDVSEALEGFKFPR